MELKWTTIEALRSGRADSASIVETQYAEWRGMTLMRTTITNDIGQTCYVDGPHQVTAPHCQPTPPADDRPPMTDEALEAWLTATYGEPEHRDGTRADGVRYKMTHWFKHFSDDEDGFVEVATRCRNDWQTHHGGGWLPAWVIGPALHAAHRYGNP
jgi:hypothetical protein